MKKKLIIAGSLVLAIVVTIFSVSTYQHHQQQEKAKQEREKYEKYATILVNGKLIPINFWRMVRVLWFTGNP